MSIFKKGTAQVVTAPTPRRSFHFGVQLKPGVAGRVSVEGWPGGPHPTNAGGYLEVVYPDAPIARGAILVEADGYIPKQLDSVDFGAWQDSNLWIDIEPIVKPFDPATVPLEQLARIRGSMWPTLDLSLGPRPGQPTNIAATDFLFNYPPAERVRLLAFLRSKLHTHGDVGPVVDSDGYHGCWSPNNWLARWDEWLDMHEAMWLAGIAPISFLKPDNWTFEQMRDALTPLVLQPRAQRLIRIAVPAGWEPTRYGWSNATWLLFFQWCRQVLPNALCLVHTVSDTDALVGEDERGVDTGRLPNGESWCRVAPYLHGWLVQSSTFERKDGITDGKTNLQNWIDLFDPRVHGSYKDRFRPGNAFGWPGGSAWGPTTPLRIYAAEYISYWKFNQQGGASEAFGEQMGDAALRVGADGAFDGCTLPVGTGPVPWQL